MHKIPDYTGVLFLVSVYRTHYLHTLRYSLLKINKFITCAVNYLLNIT